MNLCIIPAKASSTRLAKKNLLPIGGHSLIAHVVYKAFKSNLFDNIVVSSESDTILKEAKLYADCITIKRPNYLSKDPSTIGDVCKHVFCELQQSYNLNYSYFTVLLPTSPFTSLNDIKRSVEFYKDTSKPLLSVREVSFPYENLRISSENSDSISNQIFKGAPFINSKYATKIQSTDKNRTKLYISNGAIAINSKKNLFTLGRYTNSDSYLYSMRPNSSIDIDTEDDFLLAKALNLLNPMLGDINLTAKI